MTKLLVDGDIVLYSSSVASEFACDWGGDNWVLSANLEQSKDLAKRYLSSLQERFPDHTMFICISGSGNFRRSLNPEYKSNRKDTRKPIIYNPLKDWMLATYECFIEDGLEADDLLGIYATTWPGSIIVSPDKDMQCIPCWLFRKDELKEITLEEADYFHMLQTLTGDPTDGYTGCKGVGPVGAAKVLQGRPEGHWQAVVNAYEKAGMTEDDALLNARMAYILRNENYYFETKEVKLWQPNATSVTT